MGRTKGTKRGTREPSYHGRYEAGTREPSYRGRYEAGTREPSYRGRYEAGTRETKVELRYRAVNGDRRQAKRGVAILRPLAGREFIGRRIAEGRDGEREREH